MIEIIDLLYLGDRFCEQFLIGKEKISFQINCISFLKKPNCNWDFDTSNDVVHGYLVFDNVAEYEMDSLLPFNDEIYEIKVLYKINEWYTFVIYGCNVSSSAVSTDIQIRIKCKQFYVTDSEHNQIKMKDS